MGLCVNRTRSGQLLAAAFQQRTQADAVQGRPGRLRHAAQVQQRRVQVDVRSDLAHDPRLGQPRGPADEQRHAAAAFVNARLAAPHARVVQLDARRAAVVGEEHDDRIAGQLEFVECGQQPPHVVVDVLAHPVKGGHVVGQTLGVESVEVPVRHLERRMRGVVGDVAEQRLLAARTQKANRLVGQHVGDVALRRNRLSAANQLGVEIVVDVPVVETEELVEPLAGRRVGELFAVVPFAEARGAIAAGAQRFGQGDLVPPHRLLAVRHAPHAAPQRVAARQQSRSRGRAKRIDVEPLELHAGLGQGVDVGRLQVGIAVQAEIAVALIVRHDQQDVGFSRGLAGSGDPGRNPRRASRRAGRSQVGRRVA